MAAPLLVKSTRLVGILLFLLSSCASSRALESSAPALEPAVARAKLARISAKTVQLWVVVHVRAQKNLRPDGSIDEAALIAGAVEDATRAISGGADAIILINARAELPLYERVLHAVRERHPRFPLGISALAYGPENLTEGFRLARMFAADVVWCEVVPDEGFEYEDDDGQYKPAVTTPRALAFEVQQRDRPEAMHVAGVHMKYTRPTDGFAFPDAMARARGGVDGIIVTGPETGVLADAERIRTAREIAGEHVLGLASGVSVDNIESVIGFIDFAIVGTSLKRTDDPLRIDEEKVRALRTKMDALRP